MSLTSTFSSNEKVFVHCKGIYGFAEFKHEDIAEKKLDDILEEFWNTTRESAYAWKIKMTAEVPSEKLLELIQQLVTIKVTKKSPVLSASELMDRVTLLYKVITYDALYQTAIEYLQMNHMARYSKLNNGSVTGLQKEIKICQLALEVIQESMR